MYVMEVIFKSVNFDTESDIVIDEKQNRDQEQVIIKSSQAGARVRK